MATKRDFLFVGCEGGHDMQHMGGRNASCNEWCCCSVPVYECSRCGICDYGANAEARQIMRDCEIRIELERAAGIEPATNSLEG